MQLTKRKLFLGSCSVIILFIIAGLWFDRKITAPILTNKEKNVINTLFQKTKQQCIGRFLIDVPESFNNQLSSGKYIDDFKIESKFIYPPAFKQRIELREKELRNWISSVENAPALKEVIQLPDGRGVIFDRNQSGQDDLSRILEAHVYVDNIAFIIETEILDLSAHKYLERKKTYERAGFSEHDMNEKPTKLIAMKSLISRLSGRQDDEIPKDKGICIPNGFIQDDDKKHISNIYLLYETPDFRISINTGFNYQNPNDTLFSRASEINQALTENNRKTIRKKELTLAKIQAQEWLVNGTQSIYDNIEKKSVSGYPYYYFMFETLLPTSPLLNISMHNIEQKTTYSDAQMVEIWDRIVSSLRYRSNAF